jgi:hypothetical protein
MASLEPFTDRELRCEDCGRRNTWTARRQYEWARAGRFVPPSKCEDCRARRKAAVRAAAEADALALEFAGALVRKEAAADRAQAQADRDEFERDLARLDAVGARWRSEPV